MKNDLKNIPVAEMLAAKFRTDGQSTNEDRAETSKSRHELAVDIFTGLNNICNDPRLREDIKGELDRICSKAGELGITMIELHH